MATRPVKHEKPVVVIVGPTASGKTGLAIELAKAFGGEIICADSRTVFRDMDIGTAKPTLEERQQVPHWGINLVAPGERFTAAQFKEYAIEKIRDIRSRGKVPFLVGGTGLYVDSVLFDYQFGNDLVEGQRRQLEHYSVEELQKYCIENNIELPEDVQNKRRLVHAIEQKGIAVRRNSQPITTSIIVGIATEKTTLRTKIQLRAEQMLTNGVVEEAIRLGKKYGWESEAMTGNVYPVLRRHLTQGLSLDEVKDQFEHLDWQLAKRQLTWLRRNPHIHWGNVSEVQYYIANNLQQIMLE